MLHFFRRQSLSTDGPHHLRAFVVIVGQASESPQLPVKSDFVMVDHSISMVN